ncbi:hypothetical protein CEXT_157371 [Caerostris extrusa]|uniref:Uncharacterized protein n=1 Tax=Caerostris extrusa TaxID=172846 RepID=A0AAV4ND86_CAEEX|nr:hypothetical protein CEXT_157371 [Caerostris extrusa]
MISGNIDIHTTSLSQPDFSLLHKSQLSAKEPNLTRSKQQKRLRVGNMNYRVCHSRTWKYNYLQKDCMIGFQNEFRNACAELNLWR